MKKNITTILLLCAVTLGLALSGCGSTGSSDSQTAPNQSQSTSKVYGVVSLGTTTSGYVTAMDSSVPAKEKMVGISSNGSYTIDVSGLNPPYLLKAEPANNSGNVQMYSLSMMGGRININPISNAAVAAAATGNDPKALFMTPDREMYRKAADNFEGGVGTLDTVLAPLFALYKVSGNPVFDDEMNADNSGLLAMFRDVDIVVAAGILTITNKQTGSVIFSGPVNFTASGTYYPENMPGGPGSSMMGSTSCTYTYNAWGACQSDSTQIRTMATALPAGCTGTPALAQACVYVPSPLACTYTYNSWGACQSDSTQIRTVATALPAGCTGTPALTQACTYVPPTLDGAALYTSNCSGCHGALATSAKLGRTASQIQSAITNNSGGMSTLSGLTSAQIQAIATALAPASPSACTSFSYSAWGACQTDNTQSRTLASSSPAGCTGGTPVLAQSCIYVPPVTACTSFTYSAWGTCQSNSTQSRTAASSSPAGCTGGTPALTQACVYVPPPSTLTLAQVKTTCTQCHGLTVNTTVFASGGYTVTGRTASAWLSAITGMGATPAPGTTLQDYANFLATLP